VPWSSKWTPYPAGNIVIDDATGSILGVPLDRSNHTLHITP
jgi:hypothetical protein